MTSHISHSGFGGEVEVVVEVVVEVEVEEGISVGLSQSNWRKEGRKQMHNVTPGTMTLRLAAGNTPRKLSRKQYSAPTTQRIGLFYTL